MLTNGGARDAQTLKQVLTAIVDEWLGAGYLESNQPIDFTFTAESVNEARADQITDPDEAAGVMRGIADAKAGRTSTLREVDLELKAQQLEAALGEIRQALQQLQEKYDELDKAARGDAPGESDALVPQPPSEPSSTPSPVKEQEL